MDAGALTRTFRDRRSNAAVAWVLVVGLLGVVVAEFAGGDPLSAAFALALVCVVVVVPLRFRSATTMLPWELAALASLPPVGAAVATWGPAEAFASYFAVAAVALLVAVELHAFTAVRMSYGFAVVFVVVTTMAAAGVWAMVRWAADVTLGTAFIAGETALMWEFVFSTAAGVVAGGVFRLYFRKTLFEDRVPDHEIAPPAPVDPDAEAGAARATDLDTGAGDGSDDAPLDGDAGDADPRPDGGDAPGRAVAGTDGDGTDGEGSLDCTGGGDG